MKVVNKCILRQNWFNPEMALLQFYLTRLMIKNKENNSFSVPSRDREFMSESSNWKGLAGPRKNL